MKVGADRMLNSFLKLNKFNNFGHAPVFLSPENDPRITKVGHFLGKSGLNKLPSLFNVLTGNLSLIGKDPLRLYEAASLANNDSADRFVLTTGLSGMWKFPPLKNNILVRTEISKTVLAEEKKANAFTDFLVKLSNPVGSLQSFKTTSTKGS
jgi:lipopolysaccharide/colanic/teichoic acid biosynthesis glycosyltransferase